VVSWSSAIRVAACWYMRMLITGVAWPRRLAMAPMGEQPDGVGVAQVGVAEAGQDPGGEFAAGVVGGAEVGGLPGGPPRW
jgi:hypothetical protein